MRTPVVGRRSAPSVGFERCRARRRGWGVEAILQEVAPVREAASPAASGRLAGLDGIRGLAAFYVMLFHCWLFSFRGFPANQGPWWLGWLLYGHLAVVAFIVLSGFSLAVSPARH